MPTAPTSTDPTPMRIAAAEFLGTVVLMLLGPGAAILALGGLGSTLGVALGFGFALVIMAYAIGSISGCHINPAVTIGFVATGKLTLSRALYYWIAQVAGAVVGGLILFIVTEGGDDALDHSGNFAANGWGDKLGNSYGLGSVILVEIVFTALLVYVVLSTTVRGFAPGFGGLVAGLTLAAIHIATIPVDNTSVNPARSIGAAIFSGGDALSQLWAFIVWPLVGGLVGAALWAFIHNEKIDLENLARR